MELAGVWLVAAVGPGQVASEGVLAALYARQRLYCTPQSQLIHLIIIDCS